MIAIENARLLTELQARTQELTRSVEQLTALGDVGRAVSSSLDLDTVLTTIVGRAVQLSGTDGGTIFEYDEGAEEFSPRATLNADESQSALLRATRLRRGEGAVGQMAVTREPLQIPDIAAEGAYESRLRGALLEAGTRAVLAVPLLHEERIVGGLVVTRRTPGAFTTEIVEILRTFATQSALAIQNARLFREIERKSRELEVASQHKSEFLANMSHELRTPLNAIIGFSEVLSERMFGELNEKQDEYLKDIYASGQHLLSLINDILDLSKIEAGRMELELADFHLPSAVENALILVRERASRRGIALGHTIDSGLGMVRADERKVKQVLLNLLSNALKFTPEGGRVDVRAGLRDDLAEISVADTGVGIAPEDQEAVFEEFRQVGTADKKVEGTGLGLALSRKFVELHGGRIWVRSQVGEGSTFTFTLPVRLRRRWERERAGQSSSPATGLAPFTWVTTSDQAAARRLRHDVSPVPAREPGRREVLRRVRGAPGRRLRGLPGAESSRRSKFCHECGAPIGGEARRRLADLSRVLHPEAPRREDPDLQGALWRASASRSRCSSPTSRARWSCSPTATPRRRASSSTPCSS